MSVCYAVLLLMLNFAITLSKFATEPFAWDVTKTGSGEWETENGEWEIEMGNLIYIYFFTLRLFITWNNFFQRQLSIPALYF